MTAVGNRYLAESRTVYEVIHVYGEEYTLRMVDADGEHDGPCIYVERAWFETRKEVQSD